MEPESNAAGRLGLYRIIFALFALWSVSGNSGNFSKMAELPQSSWHPVFSVIWLQSPPPAWIMKACLLLVIFSLVWLLFGYKTRWATLIYMVSAVFLASINFSFGKIDHSDTFLFCYIPFMMLIYDWGQTYSVDRLLRLQRGETVPSPTEDSWQHGWTIKATIFLFAILFGTAGYIKAILGDWLSEPKILPYWLYEEGNASQNNPFYFTFLVTPLLYNGARFSVLCFESFFPLSLLHRKLRTFFVAGAIFFHTGTGIFMGIYFVPMYIAYAIFIDWQWLLGWALPKGSPRLLNISATQWFGIVMGTATFITSIWFSSALPLRRMLTMVDSNWIWAISFISAIMTMLYLARGLIFKPASQLE